MHSTLRSRPGILGLIGVKLLRGREFTQAECENKRARLAIIDEEMAKKLFQHEVRLANMFATPSLPGRHA